MVFGFLFSVLDICFCGSLFFKVYGIVLVSYLLATFVESIRLSITQNKLATLIFLMPVFWTIHFSFGWGILYEIIFGKKIKKAHSHESKLEIQ
jgi:hypothetical protein